MRPQPSIAPTPGSRPLPRRNWVLATLVAATAFHQSSGFGQPPAAPAKSALAAPQSPVDQSPALCGNPPVGGPAGAVTEDPGPPKAAFDNGKLWQERRRLVVRFLKPRSDPWSMFLRAKVREIAPSWSDYADLPMQFVETDDPPADITVNFSPYRDPDGTFHDYRTYNSLIGNTSANVKPGWASLNLVFPPELAAADDPVWGAAEIRRLILHEFGHAIGLIHEHQRADREIFWDEAQLRTFARDNWGWVATPRSDLVASQVLDPYKPKGRLIGTVFDRKSVMMYRFQKGLAWSDAAHRIPFESCRNTVLSPGDKVAAATAYPPVGIVADPEQLLGVGLATRDGHVSQVGVVVPFRVPCRPGERLRVEVAGPMPALVAWLRNPQRPRNPDDPQPPPNILGAAETPSGGGSAVLDVVVPVKDDPNDEQPGFLFLEVRHRWPLQGTGDFTISITRMSTPAKPLAP
jgi:hypothetical protein